MKVIRLNGNDIGRLVQRIIKEDNEWFDEASKYDLVGIYTRKDVQKLTGISSGDVLEVTEVNGQEATYFISYNLRAVISGYPYSSEGPYKMNVNELILDITDGVLTKYNGVSEAKVKVDKSEYMKLFEDNTMIVLRPLTHQASCKYGSGAKWCVSSRTSDKWWKNYTKKTANFAGTNWYNVKEVVEEVKKTWLDKVLGKPGEVVKHEVKEFIEQFPIGILYFVIVKKRVKTYEWDEELRYNKPIYDDANPKDPMNKLALLYEPGKSDFGDLSTSNPYDVFEYIGDKLDASHNNMSIFNALDEKVTLREVSSSIGREFNVAFRFIEEDFQKERNKIDFILKDVLDKVYPLPGDTGSKQPVTWLTGSDGQLYKAKTSDVKKGEKGERRFTGRRYKGHHPNQGNW